MRKISSNIIILGFALLSYRCDDNPQKPEPELASCVLMKIQSTASGWVEILTYSLNDERQITRLDITHDGFVHGSAILLFEYDQNENVSQITYSDGTIVIFTYGEHNQILTRDVTSSTGSSYQISEEYNLTGQKIKTTHSSFVRVYSYPNNSTKNFSKAEDFDLAGQLLKTYVFEYDEMKVPFPFDIPLERGHGIEFERFSFGLTDNNIKSVTITDNDGVYLEANLTFEYNELDYPTSISTSLVQRGIDRTVRTSESFTYECN